MNHADQLAAVLRLMRKRHWMQAPCTPRAVEGNPKAAEIFHAKESS